MPLIVKLILTWSDRYFIIDDPIENQEPTFTITGKILYVAVITLTTQGNAKHAEIMDYNVVIDGQNFFDLTVKNNLPTFDKIQKISSSEGDGHTTGCLLDYITLINTIKLLQ